jgi:hypothetical protein
VIGQILLGVALVVGGLAFLLKAPRLLEFAQDAQPTPARQRFVRLGGQRGSRFAIWLFRGVGAVVVAVGALAIVTAVAVGS